MLRNNDQSLVEASLLGGLTPQELAQRDLSSQELLPASTLELLDQRDLNTQELAQNDLSSQERPSAIHFLLSTVLASVIDS